MGGKTVTKRDAAEIMKTHPKTAALHLAKMHAAGDIRICGWVRGKNGPPIPKYGPVNGRKDKEKIKTYTKAEKSQRYRDKLGKKLYNAKHSAYRWTKKALRGDVKLGLWGY